MSTEMNVSILLRLLDGVTGPAKRVTESVTLAAKALEVAGKRSDELFKSAGDMHLAAEGISKFARGAEAIVSGPVEAAAEFDSAMRRVAVRTRASTDEIAQLNAEALRIGSTSKFSAFEATEAMNQLAHAGQGTAAIIASMPGVMNLAKVAGSGLSEAVNVVNEALGGFRLGADQTTRVADVLVATTQSSNATLLELGMALRVASPAAKTLGLSVEQTAAALGLLANAGVKGSEAGAGLKMMLHQIVQPSEEARQVLKLLGVSYRDENTKELRPLADILGDLAKKTDRFNTGQKAKIATAIFGESGPLAAQLIQSRDGLAEFSKALDQSAGAAERVAKELGGGVKGEAEALRGSITSLKIEVGQALQPALKQLVPQLRSIVRGIGEWTSAHPELSAAIMGSVGASFILAKTLEGMLSIVTLLKSARGFLALGSGLGQVASIITGQAIPAVLKFTVALLTNPIFLVIAAVALLGAGLTYLVVKWDAIAEVVSGVWQRFNKASTGVQFFIAAIASIGVVFAALMAPVLVPVAALVGAVALIRAYWEPIKGFFIGLWDAISNAMKTGVQKALDFLEPLLNNPMVKWLISTTKELASDVGGAVAGVVGAIPGFVKETASVFVSPSAAAETPIRGPKALLTKPVETITEARERKAYADRVSAVAVAPKAQVEGSIKIEIASAVPARVTQVRSSGGVQLDVGAGMAMVTP